MYLTRRIPWRVVSTLRREVVPVSFKSQFSTSYSCFNKSNDNDTGRKESCMNDEKIPQTPTDLEEENPTENKDTNSKKGLDRRVYPIALSSFLIGTSVSMILPIMPAFCKEIGVSSGGYGVIVSAVGLSRLISNLPAGWMADKFGRRPLLIGGPAITSIATAGMGLSTSFYPFLFCRILTGVGGALDMTAAQLYLSDISTRANRARIFAPAVMAFSAGSVVGPAIGGYLASNYSMNVPFLLVSAGIAGVVLNNYLMLPETKTNTQYVVRHEESFKKQLKSMISQWKPLLKTTDIRSVLYLHGSFWFVSSSCIYTMLPMIGAEIYSLSTSEIATWYVTMALINIIGTKITAYLSDQYGRKVALVPAAALIATSTALMPFACNYSQMTSLIVMWGCGGALFGANTTAYLTDKLTEGTKTQGLCLLRSCADIGLMSGGAFAGILSQYVSYGAPFMLSALLVSAAGCHMAFRASEVNINASYKKSKSSHKVNNK